MNPASYATAQRLFLADLAKNLFASNEFLGNSRDWSKSAVGNEVVWQQSGGTPGVIINNVSNALNSARRNDVRRSFFIEEYQSIPTRLDWSEELLINYEKRKDILENHINQIDEDLTMRILYNWAIANTSVTRTTGTARPAGAPAATGARNAVTYKDILDLRKKLVKKNVKLEAGKLNLLIPADLEADLMNLNEFKSRDYYPVGNGSTVMSGLLGTIAGFNVFMRSASLICNATGVPQLPKADDSLNSRAGAATDNQSIIAWHSDHVVKARSKSTKVSIIDEHGGLTMSVTAVAGGASFYNDGRGVEVLSEQ